MIPKSKRKIINPVVLSSMKQAVKEAIEECAEKATAWAGIDGEWMSYKVKYKVDK